MKSLRDEICRYTVMVKKSFLPEARRKGGSEFKLDAALFGGGE